MATPLVSGSGGGGLRFAPGISMSSVPYAGGAGLPAAAGCCLRVTGAEYRQAVIKQWLGSG